MAFGNGIRSLHEEHAYRYHFDHQLSVCIGYLVSALFTFRLTLLYRNLVFTVELQEVFPQYTYIFSRTNKEVVKLCKKKTCSI